MWKKQFYKRVFDRIHYEQWNNKKITKSSADGNAGSRSRSSLANTASPKRRRRGDDAGDSDSDSGSGGEEVFDDAYVQREMGDMVHRAAQWLTALDSSAGRSSRGRGPRSAARGGVPDRRDDEVGDRAHQDDH